MLSRSSNYDATVYVMGLRRQREVGGISKKGFALPFSAVWLDLLSMLCKCRRSVVCLNHCWKFISRVVLVYCAQSPRCARFRYVCKEGSHVVFVYTNTLV